MTIAYYTTERRAGVMYDYYSKQLLNEFSNYYFVFGDNTKRVGNGGQAIIRDMPNALGLVTKRLPSHTIDAYMTGTKEDYAAVDADLEHIQKLLDEGNTVIFPAAGVGTGLAALNVHAPKLLIYIDNHISKMIGADYEIIHTHLR